MNIAMGTISKILVIRMHRGEDVNESIKQACMNNGIKNAVIISMVGSLDGVSYFDPIINPTVKSGVSYGNPIVLERPVQLLTAQGEICHEEDGELNIHLHATFADSNGKAHGGHFSGVGNFSGISNKVLNTVNAFIGVIDGIDMGFEWDEIIGGPVFCPKQKS